MGTGSAPGTMCVVARDTMKDIDECDTLYMNVYEGVEAKRFQPYWWSPLTALADMDDLPVAWIDGKMVNTKPSFCMGFFHTVFWHRYIRDLELSPLGRLYDRLCFSYWRGAMWCYHLLKAVKPSHRPLRKAFLEGIREGLRYVKTEEYRTLPPVMGAGDAS
jgi:hypothetical protein